MYLSSGQRGVANASMLCWYQTAAEKIMLTETDGSNRGFTLPIGISFRVVEKDMKGLAHIYRWNKVGAGHLQKQFPALHQQEWARLWHVANLVKNEAASAHKSQVQNHVHDYPRGRFYGIPYN